MAVGKKILTILRKKPQCTLKVVDEILQVAERSILLLTTF